MGFAFRGAGAKLLPAQKCEIGDLNFEIAENCEMAAKAAECLPCELGERPMQVP